MVNPILGLHHVTAFSGPLGRTHEFYQHALGLRFVKLTVNHDEPGTYHLYYGDALGTPGTVITFFPWPLAKPGKAGAGQFTATSYAVPRGSLRFWRTHLAAWDIEPHDDARFGEDLIRFRDPDGLSLELVEHDAVLPHEPWTSSDIDPSCAIGAFRSVTITSDQRDETIAFFRDALGLEVEEELARRTRLRFTHGTTDQCVDVTDGSSSNGAFGPGVVHHVAFCVENDRTIDAWRTSLLERGFAVTDVRDRLYFMSIYFREPSGAVIEIATQRPGFTVDEPADLLGSGLRLPPWLEPERASIERSLPPFGGV